MECLKELVSLKESLVSKNNIKPYLLTKIPLFISFLLANHALLRSDTLKKSFTEPEFRDALERLSGQIQAETQLTRMLNNHPLKFKGIDGLTKELQKSVDILKQENKNLGEEMENISALFPATSASSSLNTHCEKNNFLPSYNYCLNKKRSREEHTDTRNAKYVHYSNDE